jgi:hypothetical protein
MPAASKSNIHGYIHGQMQAVLVNTSGVEDIYINKYSSLKSTSCSFNNLIISSLYEIVL